MGQEILPAKFGGQMFGEYSRGWTLTGPQQVACYDDGVGTSSFKPFAILGGVFGWGLKRNVLTLYEFLSRNYNEGDGIFWIRLQPRRIHDSHYDGIGAQSGTGRRRYRCRASYQRKARLSSLPKRKIQVSAPARVPLRLLRDGWLSLFGTSPVPPKKAKAGEVKIKFLGLWDTVAAYGTPIDEMTRGISQWIWPLELPNRHFAHQNIERACHALSIDDERTTFHPVLWNEEDVPARTLARFGLPACIRTSVEEPRRFTRLHSTLLDHAESPSKGFEVQGVGGKGRRSIEQDGELFDPDVFVHARSARDKDGRLYNSRSGLGGYYRYGPRKIEDLNDQRFVGEKDDFVNIQRVRIHESVIRRARKEPMPMHRWRNPLGLRCPHR